MPALLDVPIHLQDGPERCGEACAQMVVRHLRGALPSQRALATVKGPGAPRWATSPAQMAAMINAHLATGPVRYAPHLFDAGPTGFGLAMAYIDAAVTGASLPAVALLYGDSPQPPHWVVVRGLTREGREARVHFRDPTPARPAGVGRHYDGDGCRVLNAQKSGQADEWVELGYWGARKLTPAHDVPASVRTRRAAARFVVVGPVLETGSRGAQALRRR